MTRPIDRMTRYVAAAGALLVAGAFLIGGRATGLAAAVGAAVALVNWVFLRWLLRRVAAGGLREKRALMVLLALKMGALIAICWGLLARFDLEPVGFVVGLSAFMIGVFVGSAVHASTSPFVPSTPSASRQSGPHRLRRRGPPDGVAEGEG